MIPPPSARFADPLTEQLAAFLRSIGVNVQAGAVEPPTPCPGLRISGGVILVDEARLTWPGDLLHEAGHLAVCEAGRRASLDEVGDDAGEEMAAIAWSFAAARHLGLDPAVVFHEGGYQGGGAWLIPALEIPGGPGVPMLGW